MKKQELAVLIQDSPLLKTKEEKQEWLDVILPKLSEEDLIKVGEIFVSAKEKEQEVQTKRAGFLQEKLAKVKQLYREAKKAVFVQKEKKSLQGEQQILSDLEADIDNLPIN